MQERPQRMLRGRRDSQYWTEPGNWFLWIFTSLQYAELSHLLDDITRGSGKAVLVILVLPSGRTAGSSTKYKLQCPAVSNSESFALLVKTKAAKPTPTEHMWEVKVFPVLPVASVSLPACFKGRNLWKDRIMQFRKTGKDFLIKQKIIALFTCEW